MQILLLNPKPLPMRKVLLLCLLWTISSTLMGQLDMLHKFTTETNQNFYYSLTTDGTFLYGTKWDGGLYGKGYVYRVGIDNGEFKVLLDFDGENSGSGGYGPLVLKGNDLYGITRMGGVFNGGTLFRIKTDGSDYKKLLDCESPLETMVIADNIIYGTASLGAFYMGAIYKVTTDGEDFELLHSFSGSDGWNPSSVLTLQDGFLYGTTSRGGSNDNGVVFKIQADGEGFTVLKDDFVGDISVMAGGNLVIVDETIYGTTSQGGENYGGYIYRINTDGSSFEIITELSDVQLCNPTGLVYYNSALYGMTVNTETGPLGSIFKVDPSGDDFSILHTFMGVDGGNPDGVLCVFNDTFYGYTNKGLYNYGSVFSIQPDGSDFRKIKDLEATNTGYFPQGSVVVTEEKCYGITQGGGVFNRGTIYAIEPDGQNHQVIHDFSSNDGAVPLGPLMLSSDILYGITELGGIWSSGTLYSFDLASGTFNNLIDFNTHKGSFPRGKLTKLGDVIYGAASCGGLDNRGLLFSVNADGSDYSVLFDFAGTDLTRPIGSLLEINSVFYGLASHIDTDYLVLYSIGVDGTNFQVIYESDGTDAGRYGIDLSTDGSFLYGLSSQGGTNDFGVLFKIKPDGSDFSQLHDFSFSNGAHPIPPIQIVDNTIFISTSFGGESGLGGIISIGIEDAECDIILDYGDIGSDGLKSASTKGYISPLKSSPGDRTEAAITIRGNDVYLVAEQTKGGRSDAGFLKFSLIPLSKKEIYMQKGIIVYPNPTVDYIKIESEDTHFHIELFNSIGVCILQQTIHDGILDVSGLSSGMYILKINNKTAKFFKK